MMQKPNYELLAQTVDILSRDTPNVHLRQAAMKFATLLRAFDARREGDTS